MKNSARSIDLSFKPVNSFITMETILRYTLRKSHMKLLFGVFLMVLPFPATLHAQYSPPPLPEPLVAPSQFSAPMESETKLLTLAELQFMAVSRHPELFRLQHVIRGVQGEWIQNGLYPNPEVSLSALELGDDGGWGKQEVEFSQEIVTHDKIRLSQNVSRQDIEIARQQYAIEYMTLGCLVKVRVYELLAAEKMVGFQKQLLEINEKSLQTVEKMHAASEVSVVDVLQARTKRNQAALELQKAQNEAGFCWNRLTTAIGVPELVPAPITEPLEIDTPEIYYEQAWSQIVSGNPQLHLAQKGIFRAGAALRYEKAAAKPNFTLSAIYGHNQGTNDSYGSIGVGIPLPIRNRNQGNIQKAAAGISAAQCDVDVLTLQLREKFYKTYTQYQNARESVQAYSQTILPDIQKNLELSEKGYQQGELPYLDFLSAQQDFIVSQQSYIQSLKDLAVSKALIDGLLLVDPE